MMNVSAEKGNFINAYIAIADSLQNSIDLNQFYQICIAAGKDLLDSDLRDYKGEFQLTGVYASNEH